MAAPFASVTERRLVVLLGRSTTHSTSIIHRKTVKQNKPQIKNEEADNKAIDD